MSYALLREDYQFYIKNATQRYEIWSSAQSMTLSILFLNNAGFIDFIFGILNSSLLQ